MAAQKVYWITMRVLLQHAYNYGTRWQSNMVSNITTEQYNCLVSTLAAIAACLALLPKNTPVN